MTRAPDYTKPWNLPKGRLRIPKVHLSINEGYRPWNITWSSGEYLTFLFFKWRFIKIPGKKWVRQMAYNTWREQK